MTYLNESCRTAIFDVDGTLIDSMEAWRFSSGYYLTSLGFPAESVDTVGAFDRGGLRCSCQAILKVYPQLGSRESLSDAITMSMLPLYRHTLPEMPHAREFLRKLYRDGLTLCVLTANLREVVEPGLARLQMMPFFSEILCCGEIRKTKESADAYTYCAGRFGVAPGECVMFEDQPWAAANAKAAGMRVIGVCKRTDSVRWAELERCCDLVISDYIELMSEGE